VISGVVFARVGNRSFEREPDDATVLHDGNAASFNVMHRDRTPRGLVHRLLDARVVEEEAGRVVMRLY